MELNTRLILVHQNNLKDNKMISFIAIKGLIKLSILIWNNIANDIVLIINYLLGMKLLSAYNQKTIA